MQRISHFFIDVDGCLTDGTYGLGPDGKKLWKVFGVDDTTAVRDLQDTGVTVTLISADKGGWAISEAKAKNMGVPLVFAPEKGRAAGLAAETSFEFIAYMGDGRYDAEPLSRAGLGIAPAGAHRNAISAADYVCMSSGGHRAVAEACDYIIARNLDG